MTHGNLFGETIRKARMAQNTSLREAAKLLGISPSYLSSFENNTQGSTPDEALLKKIADLTKVDLGKLKALAMTISKTGFSRALPEDEVRAIQTFYRIAHQHDMTVKEAVRFFCAAIKALKVQQ